MRISKQISGGRGEYEWCDLTDADPAWGSLIDRRILLRLPGGIILDTACNLATQGGKSRIRVAQDARIRRRVHPVYHVATALLLPWPTRKESNMGSGLPVLRADEYIITDIIADSVALTESGADMEVRTVRAANYTVPGGEDVDVLERFNLVRQLWANRGRLPEGLSDLLGRHEALVSGGDQIAIAGGDLISSIQQAAAESSRELAVMWCTPRTDPLPTLLEMAGLPSPDPAEMPIEGIPPEHPEIRRREVARQRRMAARRGPESARFRRAVRQAYDATCIVCGLRLPQVGREGTPGVDAAHILPYSKFDMDLAANGLCLCKLHHWAFDEALIEIRASGSGGYEIAIPDEADARAQATPGFDLGFLRAYAGPIPDDRLPSDPTLRPSADCLRALAELLRSP